MEAAGGALETKYGERGEGVGGAYWFPGAEGRRGKREERSRDGGGEAMIMCMYVCVVSIVVVVVIVHYVNDGGCAGGNNVAVVVFLMVDRTMGCDGTPVLAKNVPHNIRQRGWRTCK